MARFWHWTPRYVFNRIRWGIYQRHNMDKPWITPRSIELLSTLIVPSDTGFEWGSGRSTRWFAARMKHLTSVEDNPEWYERVRSELTKHGVRNVDYRLMPEPPREDAQDSEYVRAAATIADRSLGFALVDGSAREYCAEAILPKLAPGGLLVIDNINWYLDHPTKSPASRVGKGPVNDKWASVAQTLSNWRVIWTSSGVTDTAIWMRPDAC